MNFLSEQTAAVAARLRKHSKAQTSPLLRMEVTFISPLAGEATWKQMYLFHPEEEILCCVALNAIVSG